MSGSAIEKLYDYMKQFTDQYGIILSLYYNGNSDIVRVAANDETTFVTYNTYYTEHKINGMEYDKFEEYQIFADEQERLRRADVKANVGIKDVLEGQE